MKSSRVATVAHGTRPEPLSPLNARVYPKPSSTPPARASNPHSYHANDSKATLNYDQYRNLLVPSQVPPPRHKMWCTRRDRRRKARS